MDPTETQLHVLKETDDFGRLIRRLVRRRDVLELGVGTGALTRLILDANAYSVVGFEIVPDVCHLKSEKLDLRIDDYTRPGALAGIDSDACLIASPAYKTLPYIEQEILPNMHDVVIVIPEKMVGHYTTCLRFERVFALPGTAFEPVAEGMHVVMLRGFEDARTFVDLAHELEQVTMATGATGSERLGELARLVPGASITAVGGLPITFRHDGFELCGAHLTTATLRELLRQGLGHSGLLTYTNRRALDRSALGGVCLDRDETWAYHWMNLTLLLAGYSPRVQLAFARDTRFHLSWTNPSPGAVVHSTYLDELHTFEATGNLKAWIKFCAKQDDPSFDGDTRHAMRGCAEVLRAVLP